MLDAISDPIVGYWSDNFRSRWGRRHPFMYASAIPITVSYFLLWSPPIGWSNDALFWYVLTLAILTRTFLTFFELLIKSEGSGNYKIWLRYLHIVAR